MAPYSQESDLSTAKGSRVHKTFLFTDIVRSTDIRTAVIREFGDTGNQKYDHEVLAPHDEILNRFVAEFNGVVVSTAGDSYFVVFDGAQSAVQCAVNIQSKLIKERIPLPVSKPQLPPYLQIRIGLHTGGARELLRAARPNYSDQTINIAARIEGLADGEQVLMSEETWNSAGRLEGVSKHEWKGCELKGLDGVWTVVEALWDGRVPRAPRLHAQPAFGSGNPAPPFILPQLDVATFTGRVEELRRLESLLLRPDGAKVCSIVGLAGGGGIGKSALACHFAALHRDAFPEGVLGLRVDGKNNDTIAREFSRLCGEEIAPDDEREAGTIMQEVFGHRRMLLIFDNAEDAAIQVLRPGGHSCAVIITTRDRQLPLLLDVPGEGCIDLSPLPPPDARLLLEQLIGEQRVATEADAIEAVTKLIGSLPLALQIVGSTLQLQQDRKIDDYATSLRAERKRLEMLKVRGASHLDVLASFSLSLRLLTDEEIDFFACQSVCAQDGFSLQAAMAAGGCDEARAYNRLNYLYRLSLLNRPKLGVSRYVFHTLIRLFAQDLSVERSLRAAAAERHARYFIELVKTSVLTNHRTAVLAVEDVGDCILTAAWLQQQQTLDYEFLIGLEHFLDRHGYLQQAATLMTDFLPLAENQEDWPIVARFRIKKAKYQWLLGDWAEAEQALVLAAGTIDQLKDYESRQLFTAMWFSILGGLRQREARFDEAAHAFERSAAIDEQRGDWNGQAMELNRLGSVLQRQGHFAEAVDTLHRSLLLCEQSGDEHDIAKVLNSLGSVLQRQGDFNAAAEAFRRSAAFEELLQDHHGQAIALTSLGGVLQRQGHFDEAADTLRRSLSLCEQFGDHRSIAMALNSLGGVLQRQGLYAEAADSFERSYGLLIEVGDRRGQAMVLNSLGGVLQRQGRLAEAVGALRRSAAIEAEFNNKPGHAKVLTTLGVVLQRQGHFDDAIEALKNSAVIEDQSGNQRGQAMVLSSLGTVFARQGHIVQAIDAFERSVKIGEMLNDRRHLAMVHTAMGRALLYHGDFERATTELSLGLTIEEDMNNRRGVSIVTSLLVKALTKLGRLDEASAYCRRALAIVPEDTRLKALSEGLAAPVVQQDDLVIQGTVKFIIPHERGYRYGFIVPDDAGADIYFQEWDVQPDALPDITDGARVEFQVVAVTKGLQAKNVRVILAP